MCRVAAFASDLLLFLYIAKTFVSMVTGMCTALFSQETSLNVRTSSKLAGENTDQLKLVLLPN